MATCLGSGKAGAPPDIPIGQAVHLVPLLRQRVLLPIAEIKSILCTIFAAILNHFKEKGKNSKNRGGNTDKKQMELSRIK